MKKVLSFILAVTLILSLASCGEGGDELTSVKWVNLYTGSTLTLNADHTMEVGDQPGTWSQDNDSLTLSYTTLNGTSIELYADIINENENTILRTKTAGKSNGQLANFSISEYYSEDKVDSIRASLMKKPGETVSTDIMEVTVKTASLSYYAASPETSVGTGETTNIDRACEPAESGFFSCNKGHVLVCLDFVLKNTDRASLNTGDYVVSFAVRQGEHYSIVRGYDLNNPDGSYGLNLAYSPVAKNGESFKTNNTSNIIVDAGDTYEIKMVGVAGFEVEDITAPFEVVLTLEDSSGNKNNFLYDIQ